MTDIVPNEITKRFNLGQRAELGYIELISDDKDGPSATICLSVNAMCCEDDGSPMLSFQASSAELFRMIADHLSAGASVEEVVLSGDINSTKEPCRVTR